MIDSIEKYRLFDLCLLSVLAIVAEVMGELLSIRLPGAGYYISFSILVAIIAMIRWGAYGAVVYILASIPMVILHDGPLLENVLLFPFSYAFIVISSIFFKGFDRHRIKEDKLVLLLFMITAFLSVSVGKGLAMYFLVGDFLKSVAYYGLTQLFSGTIVYLVLLVIRDRKGLLVDMNIHLREQQNG